MKSTLTILLFLIAATSFVSAQGKRLTRADAREAERRLSEMGYWTGPVDGVLDPGTQSALIAFQKWEGRPITGKLTREELDAIRTSTSPKARDVGYAHVEVDIDRQVLLIVNYDESVRVLPVSTGSGKPFMCSAPFITRITSAAVSRFTAT
jgi:peptidoglycan hydrolase-like protein with peptidoglycan-binding domain